MDYEDYTTIKYSSDGEMRWLASYNGPRSHTDAAVAIAVDSQENIYVAGGSTSQVGSYDFLTIKYYQIAGQITATLIPMISPIQIPATGGSFQYLCFVENGTASSQTVDLWTHAVYPNSTYKIPVLGPAQQTIPTGVTGWYRMQMVPRSAPAGNYSYIGYVGDYPYYIWGADTLALTKLSSGSGAVVNDWDLTQLPIDNEMDFANREVPPLHAFNPSFPSPFNATTTISYQLSANSHVNLRIFDTAGRLVATLVDGWREAGSHEATFDGSSLTSGVYICRLNAGNFTATQKLVLLK